MTGIERQIAPILHKVGKRVFNMSLEASSFSYYFRFVYQQLTVRFHSVVISEVMIASLFV